MMSERVMINKREREEKKVKKERKKRYLSITLCIPSYQIHPFISEFTSWNVTSIIEFVSIVFLPKLEISN